MNTNKSLFSKLGYFLLNTFEAGLLLYSCFFISSCPTWVGVAIAFVTGAKLVESIINLVSLIIGIVEME